MDVKQTVKINQLVNEFKKHGIATEEEAIKEATRVISKEALNGMQKEEVSQEILNMINRKMQYLSELSEKRLKEETDKLRAEVGNMAGELKALRDMVKDLASRPAPKPEQQTLKAEVKEGKKVEEAKPRSGDFEPGDVDINDVFYFGNKK